MPNALDLLQLFTAASKTLTKNQDSLNQADAGNHDHGDNMVQAFDLITGALRSNQGGSASDQLASAAKALLQNATSGSSKVYAQGLSQAAQQFQGQNINAGNVGQLLQTLLGAGTVEAPQPQQSGGDILGGLLSTLVGGGQQQSGGGGNIDAGSLLNAGLSYMQSKQQGKGDVEALINAVVGSSPMSQDPHRAQSATLITQAFLALASKAKTAIAKKPASKIAAKGKVAAKKKKR
jgi:hypothetical protein